MIQICAHLTSANELTNRPMLDSRAAYIHYYDSFINIVLIILSLQRTFYMGNKMKLTYRQGPVVNIIMIIEEMFVTNTLQSC